jgi:phenylalanyl-tRNA synthetase beta chain
MARELTALSGVPLSDPAELHNLVAIPAPVTHAREVSSGGATVRLEDIDGCPHYMGVVLRGVRVAASPDWLVQRLESVGLRPISNVVDVTNYMLHAYGQPMHAFDLARVTGSTVVIRRATPGERLVTLDGIERALDERMTVIADAQRPMAVAGVMGGRDSEVGAGTTDVFLEVAWFTPRNVRVTRRALGLTTDASYRFERGIDPQIAPRALQLAAGLLAMVAGARVDGSPMAAGSPPAPSHERIRVRPKRVERLLGDRVTVDEMTRLLRSVGFAVDVVADDELAVSPPSWRNDVSRDADLLEEVARLRGYDRLPDTVLPFRPGTVPDHPLFTMSRRVRDLLVGAGLAELRPMPFVRGSDETHARVTNPLAADEPHLRRSLLETLAMRAEYNLTRMQGNVRLFEIGSAFEPKGDDLPLEELRVAALIMGDRRPAHFTEPRPPAFDAWDAKALAERIAELVFSGQSPSLEPDDGKTIWTVRAAGKTMGEVRLVELDRPPWAADAYGIEITLAELHNEYVAPPGQHVHAEGQDKARAPSAPSYRPLPTTPAAEIDVALLVPDGVSVGQVERVLRASGGELLEQVALFDEYRGASLPTGVRSVAWRLTFRDPVRTLRDKEIEGRRQKILRSLESELGVRLRPPTI